MRYTTEKTYLWKKNFTFAKSIAKYFLICPMSSHFLKSATYRITMILIQKNKDNQIKHFREQIFVVLPFENFRTCKIWEWIMKTTSAILKLTPSLYRITLFAKIQSINHSIYQEKNLVIGKDILFVLCK